MYELVRIQNISGIKKTFHAPLKNALTRPRPSLHLHDCTLHTNTSEHSSRSDTTQRAQPGSRKRLLARERGSKIIPTLTARDGVSYSSARP